MEHVTEHAWADFVRGVGTPEFRTAIEGHLAGGCRDCRSAAKLWTSLAEMAAREHGYTPPSPLVALLNSQFAGAKMMAAPRRFLAGLIFDSFTRPLPAGIRSGAAVARQLVYEVEGMTVDLRIDRHANSQRLSIVGQVLDARVLRLAPENVPVALLNGQGEPLQRTCTSNFGEFHLEATGESGMQLAIELDTGNTVCIALPSPACDHPGDFGERNRLPERAPK